MRSGWVQGLSWAVWLAGCGGTETLSADAAIPASTPMNGVTDLGPAPRPDLPGLLLVQAQFAKKAGKPVPGAAHLELLQTDGTRWYRETLDDPESNVFHKAVPWRGGFLTIGAEKARLVHWTRGGAGWSPRVLWEKSWGGSFDRLRDLEIGDVTGDGKEDIVLATHDQGVIVVGQEAADASWTFTELDAKPDTFVHEIEIGDVEGDAKIEFYATPSARNRANGESQPGSVVRYDFDRGRFVRSELVAWTESHAKEILVADMDGKAGSEVYAAREAHTFKGPDGAPVVKDPVRIVRFDKNGQGWSETTIATIDDRQCRFLLAADIDGDGKAEMIAASWKKGLFLLRVQADGSFQSERFEADSTGFEHATFATDLDRDGKAELYVAADDQRSLRRYAWNGTTFDRSVVAPIPEGRITWNIQNYLP